MNYKLIIDDKAILEIQKSYDYYELISIELGDRFLKTIWYYLEKIQNNPKHFQIKFNKTREAFIKDFPFVIIYEVFEDEIIVYSVFHTSRNPSKKLNN